MTPSKGIPSLSSNLVQFKPSSEGRFRLFRWNLHSNLVQFKPCRRRLWRRATLIYIPIWYNSSKFQLPSCSRKNRIYIPIWYNSSGIQFCSQQSDFRIYIPIWYNSSEPGLKSSNIRYLNLHSNLVQFKRAQNGRKRKPLQIYIPIWYNSS